MSHLLYPKMVFKASRFHSGCLQFSRFFFSPLSIVGCFVNSISQLLNRFLWNSDGVWVSHDETCIYVAGIHELVKSDANPTSGDIKVDFFFRKIRTL